MQADEVIFTVDRMAYVWEDVVIAGHVVIRVNIEAKV